MSILNLVLGALALAVSQPASPPSPQPQPFPAEQFAAGLQARLPIEAQPGIVWVSARAEGPVMVFTFEASREMLAPGPERIAQLFLGGFCADPLMATLFERGMRIRVDAGPQGQPPTLGQVIGRCPG